MGLGVFRPRNPCRRGLWHGRVVRSADEPGPSLRVTRSARPSGWKCPGDGTTSHHSQSLDPRGARLGPPGRRGQSRSELPPLMRAPGPVRGRSPHPSHPHPPPLPPRPTTGPHRLPPARPGVKCEGASQTTNVFSGALMPPRRPDPGGPIRKRIGSVSDNTSKVGARFCKPRESRNRRSGFLSDRSAYLTNGKQKTSPAFL